MLIPDMPNYLFYQRTVPGIDEILVARCVFEGDLVLECISGGDLLHFFAGLQTQPKASRGRCAGHRRGS